VIDADFDHNGVQSGDIEVINGSKITTLASMVITDAISLDNKEGPLVDAINNGSALFIGGQKVDENWFYLRDQTNSGAADVGDRLEFISGSVNKPHPLPFADFTLTPIATMPAGIAEWNIPGWTGLKGTVDGVDDRNDWVGPQLTNIRTGQVVDGTQGYYFYQVI
jgi:hypothetical protein